MMGIIFAGFALAACTFEETTSATVPKTEKAAPVVSKEGQPCLDCHKTAAPGAVKDWQDSKHAAKGVDCNSCHGASGKDRPDVKDHNGFKIVVLVTPKDCQTCHARAASEFMASQHADGAKFIGSLDNMLGEIIGGGPAANVGCKQCHGSTVMAKAGELDPTTWPNTGIGRLNPDGSKGSCTACHSRHIFSVAQARQPEICGKCHLGPDHPQMEVWQESKHGARYYEATQAGQKLNIDLPAGQWMPGRDYSAGPTCASCHMSATPSQPVTHDIGARISWTLRPAVSTKLPEWEKKRASMSDVCVQCHSPNFGKNFYAQFDALVNLYNTKYATPAKTIMDKLTAAGKLTDQPFDAKIKWTYYELWHHEGRRARHGASMAGPDYAWWHGIYDVSKVFYTEFVPEARALDRKIVDDVINPMNEHDWFTKGLSKEQVSQILDFYKSRYGQ
ncbi:MAG: cytochrome C552 [Chloroflexi bacterium]|nr:cytochrome C552 [Chloroflexota bacterium]